MITHVSLKNYLRREFSKPTFVFAAIVGFCIGIAIEHFTSISWPFAMTVGALSGAITARLLTPSGP
jgi:F0F1-type ATP synthase assembly protein I